MAITESRRQSDLEKRLKLLRQQVYGRESAASSKYYVPSEKTEENIHNTDTIYLYKDLFKILALSSVVIGVQLILFILTKKNILNLNFF